MLDFYGLLDGYAGSTDTLLLDGAGRTVWNKPRNRTLAFFWLCGGGGGGGNGAGGTSATLQGGGGGGGSSIMVAGVMPLQAITDTMYITIGQGGTATVAGTATSIQMPSNGSYQTALNSNGGGAGGNGTTAAGGAAGTGTATFSAQQGYLCSSTAWGGANGGAGGNGTTAAGASAAASGRIRGGGGGGGCVITTPVLQAGAVGTSCDTVWVPNPAGGATLGAAGASGPQTYFRKLFGFPLGASGAGGASNNVTGSGGAGGNGSWGCGGGGGGACSAATGAVGGTGGRGGDGFVLIVCI